MARIIELKLPKALAAALRIPRNDGRRQQLRVLKKLLRKARFTEFGQKYRFDEILHSKHIGKEFQAAVPVHDYSAIYEQWWKKTLDGVPDVTWPGKIKYYALSSGTSDAASKYIPVTKEMLRSNRVNYLRQWISLMSYEHLPRNAVTKGFLMLGGATDLQKGAAGWYAGDLSG
ncbi:MAG: GH3 auxin-responsive promoter, partial [Chitinophagaceae bacterium]